MATRKLTVSLTPQQTGAKQTFTGTAYGPPWDSSSGMQGGGITSAGVDLRQGQPAYVVATDPAVIPTGSKLRAFPNPFGDPSIVFTAADKGQAIKGQSIDFYDWRGRASQNAFGRRTDVKVQVLGPTAQASAGSPGGFLQVGPNVDVQHVNPVLLSRLEQLAAGVQQTLTIFSGYRSTDQPKLGAASPTAHSSGLAADVNIGGSPIASVLGWQTIEKYGLRSGADPGLQPFDPGKAGGYDPAHVDLLNAQGSAPATGLFYSNPSIPQIAPGLPGMSPNPFGPGLPLPPTTIAAAAPAATAAKTGWQHTLWILLLRSLEVLAGLGFAFIALRAAATWVGGGSGTMPILMRLV